MPTRLPDSESVRPSLDFSSIGPSQSASQIGHSELPPPVSMVAVMNSVMSGNTTQTRSSNEQTDTNGKRPPSHQSSATGSSIFSSNAVPATYQVETVTYAPAIAVHVSGKEAGTPPIEATPSFPSFPMPAPHALEGYVYDMPTATNSAAGPSRLQDCYSRSDSGYSTPQGTGESSAIPMRHVLERRITEDSQEDRQRNSHEQSEVSSFEEVKEETKLVEEGKLAVVENPRFLTEARRREMEKEKEKAKKEEAERNRKGKGREADEEPATREREKKRFTFFHSSKADRNLPQEAHASAITSPSESINNGDKSSPSKGFIGSLRGFFGGKSPRASPSQQSLFRTPIVSPRAEVDDSDHQSDSDTEISPSKAQGKGLQGLFRPSDKIKATTPSGRWETRTEKNIRSLGRQRSYDGELVKPPPNRYAGGIAGATVAQAGIVTATGIGHRTRAASDVGDNTSHGDPQAPAAGRRLKKARAGGQSATAPTSAANAGTNSKTVQRANTTAMAQRNPSSSVQTSADAPAAQLRHRRSASVDPNDNRRSWTEKSDEGEGDGMIVDLGRRRRVASEVGGTKAQAQAQAHVTKRESQGVDAPPSMSKVRSAAGAPRTSQSTVVERQTDVFGSTPKAQGYSSDTAVGQAGATAVAKKKSLSKKRGPDTTGSTAHLHSVSGLSSVLGHSRSVSTPAGNSASAAPHAVHTGNSGTTTVLTAGGEHPSGVLVPQRGWDAHAHAQGGGLSRNSSVVSAASAPTGGTRPKKKGTALGQGMGGGGGVARRASLTTNSPSQTKGEGSTSHTAAQAPVFQPLPPALNLMSIVEDVARTNREGWQRDLKTRKSVGGSQKAAGMIDVVRAPPPVGRSTLEALGASHIRSRAAGSTTTLVADASTPSRTGMFEIKAPGSVFDQRKESDVSRVRPPTTENSFRYAAPKMTQNSQSTLHLPQDTRLASRTPLRSAMRNSSRSPSPVTVRTPSQPAPNPEGHTSQMLPPPVNGALPWGSDGKLHQSRKAEQGKSAPPPEDVDPSGDSASEVFYSDLEEFEREAAPPPVPAAKAVALASRAQPHTKTNINGSKPLAMGDMNGHADPHIHAGKTPSELSHSSNSTYIAGSALRSGVEYSDATPRRRKSVRVSLQPTFSPSPPAIEDYEEAERYQTWASQDSRHTTHRAAVAPPSSLPAPVPVRAVAMPAAVSTELDMWADSDDEDEQYSKAKRMLTRAARKEKDVSLLVSHRGH